MKNGPLSVSEKFYIEQKWTGESLESLAKTLNRSKETVNKHIVYCRKNGIGVKLDRQTEAREVQAETFNVASQFVSKRGATVMTENASNLADELRRNNRSQTLQKSCVTKVRNNE